MPQIGGKNAKKTSSDSKRHFTVVMGNKEHGLYVSSTPSSAAKKAVTKLCAANKSKKVEFHIREITQGSKKKTYGPYMGYVEKLKKPIELKGRVIKHNPVAKLIKKNSKKMRGGGGAGDGNNPNANQMIKNAEELQRNSRILSNKIGAFKTRYGEKLRLKQTEENNKSTPGNQRLGNLTSVNSTQGNSTQAKPITGTPI
jgi:hypothetical protein